jgi:CRP/FNR family transcriptional regulator, anaerobic regulatory protein
MTITPPRTDWIDGDATLATMDDTARRALSTLVPVTLPKGQTLFCPGEAARGFVVVLSGRIDVFLTGANGRDILLYSVEPGQSCVQSTLGLMGGADYTGEALTATDCRAVLIPREMFMTLMDRSDSFRHFVFGAFAGRMQGMMELLEKVAFQRVESRLADTLLVEATGTTLHLTHAELAVKIGSAREVVSRQLERLSKRGIVTLERGKITLTDIPALQSLARGQ